MLLLTTSTVVAPSASAHQRFAPSSVVQLQTNLCQCKGALGSNLRWPKTRRFCSADGVTGDGSEEEGRWNLDAELDKVLMDEDSRALLQDLKAAAERVAAARRDLEELDKREKSAGIGAARTESLDAADFLVAECQRAVFEAEADVKMAEIALVNARAGSSVRDIPEKWEREGIDEDRERVESGKAAAVSALFGTLAGLPWSVAMLGDVGFEPIVSAGLVFMSCALFGITYRYAVRHDLGNTQLKAGCAAAFALVRGLGQIDASKVFSGLPEGAVQKLLVVCTIFGEDFAIFFFAAVGLDYCYRQGYINPFPSRPE